MNRSVVGALAAAFFLTACSSGGHDGHVVAAQNPAPPAASTAPSAEAPMTSAPAAPAAPAPGTVEIDVAIAGGKVTTAKPIVDVPLGKPVLLVVTSDKADMVHVHGYDKEAAVTPDQPLRLTFDATIPGVFEVELHSTDLKLLRLRVR